MTASSIDDISYSKCKAVNGHKSINLIFKRTTERGSAEELLAMEEKQEGLEVFWESESRVEGGGGETAFFNVSISLYSGQKDTKRGVRK